MREKTELGSLKSATVSDHEARLAARESRGELKYGGGNLAVFRRNAPKAGSNTAVLEETLHIFKKGSYVLDGKKVSLKLTKDRQRKAVVYDAHTVAAMRSAPRGGSPSAMGRCRYEVVNRDSFDAAREIAQDDSYRSGRPNVLVLNFANPVSPGGGVRVGANAQEEDLCRKSSLLLSLESEEAAAFYSAHRRLGGYLASDAMILSPEVEIIRGADGALLPETAIVSVLTCAAPAIRFECEPPEKEELERLLYTRIMGMLQLAAHEGYRDFVLGAWGCGAFGNDPDMVSDMFYKAFKDFRFGALRERDVFSRIVFAVLDRYGIGRNLRAFERNFTDFYRDEREAEIQRVKARIRQTQAHLDGVRGCLLGGAIGDALGYPVEFMSWEEIRGQYGAGGIREYALDRDTKLALISDDTQMTLFTACGLLYEQTRESLYGVAPETSDAVYMAYLDWLGTQEGAERSGNSISWILGRKELHARRAPGNTCLSALSSGLKGSIEWRINNSKGCGGVMRIAPAGLVCPEWTGRQVEALDKEGAEIAAITHGHPLGFIPAAFLTHAIHQAAFHRDEYASLDGVMEEAMAATENLFGDYEEFGFFKALVLRAARAAANARPDAENIHALGGGWTAEEAVAIAAYCALKYQGDFTKAAVAAVNHSGDSDSTGAITGNLLGAWLGYEKIEARWKENLELSDVILELAEDLCHGCQMREHSPYKDEKWIQKYIGGGYLQ